jgi:hypothetical protein
MFMKKGSVPNIFFELAEERRPLKLVDGYLTILGMQT